MLAVEEEKVEIRHFRQKSTCFKFVKCAFLHWQTEELCLPFHTEENNFVMFALHFSLSANRRGFLANAHVGHTSETFKSLPTPSYRTAELSVRLSQPSD